MTRIRGQRQQRRVEPHIVKRYGADQTVPSRVQNKGLTFTLFRARICPTQRHVVIAQYRLRGQDNAKSK